MDIERDPADQGFDLHRVDLLLAGEVLSATRNLRETLGNCRRLLAPSGVLLAVEGMQRRGVQDLTFGLLEGWWRFADEYRSDHPLVPAAGWKRVLSDAGYGRVAFVGAPAPVSAKGGGAKAGLGASILVARGPAEVRPDPGLWVVWPGIGPEGLAADLARALEDESQTVMVLPAGESGQPAQESPPREWWRDRFRGLPDDPPLRGVVHVGAAGERGRDTDLPERVERDAQSALALVQGLTDAGRASESGVWFVTRGGQVLGGKALGELSGAALWGLARVAAREIPDCVVRTVDLDPGGGAPAEVLARELLFRDGEIEIAWREGKRRLPRLIRLREAPPDPGPERVREDRTYLVTGGLGGIGLEVAGWLADRGAGAIVLNGRRPPEDAAVAAVERLRSRGAEVRVALGDVADARAVDRLLVEVEEWGLPPLGGVIHSAGILSDAAFANQDPEGFGRVLAPKVRGAWNLHRATLGRELDLFVVFSSVAALIGNPGQANYAAANAFLDQLAHCIGGLLGLPGQAIAWGGVVRRLG